MQKSYPHIPFYLIIHLIFVCLYQTSYAQSDAIYTPYVYAPYDSTAKGFLLKNIQSGKIVNPLVFDRVDRLDDRNLGLYYGFLCDKGGKKYLYRNNGVTPITEPFDEFLPVPSQNAASMLFVIRKEKSFYLLNFDKGILPEPGVFEEWRPLYQGLCIRKQNKDYRILSGETPTVSLGFDQIKQVYFPTHPTHFVATNNGKWGIANANGNTLVPFEYDSIMITNYVHLRKNGKWGLATLDYKLLIDCKYDQVYNEWNPNYFHIIQNGKHGLLDTSLHETFPPIYDYLYPAYENKSNGATWSRNHFFVKYQGKWGLLNEQNKWRIKNLYDSIIDARSHFIYVLLDKKMSVIDSNGKVLFPFKYAQVLRSDNDFRFAATKPFYFVSNDTLKPFQRGSIRWGMADNKGTLLQPMIHCKVRLQSYYEFRNPEQNSLFYENIDSNFVAFVWNKGGQLNYVTFGGDSVNQEVFDKNGNTDYVKVPNTTKTAFISGGKSGLMNAKGIMILPQEYDDLVFRFENRSYSDNLKSAALSDPQQLPMIGYDEEYWISKKDPIIARNGKFWGVISMYGKIIIPFEYDSIGWHEENIPWEAKNNEVDAQEDKVLMFELKRNKQIGYANTKGVIRMPAELDGELHNFLVRKTVVPVLSEADYNFTSDSETRAYILENVTRNTSKHVYLKAFSKQSSKVRYNVHVRYPDTSTPNETDSVRYSGGFDFPSGGKYILLNGMSFQQQCPWAEDILLFDKNKIPVQLSDFGSYLRFIGWDQYSDYHKADDSTVIHQNIRRDGPAAEPWFHFCFLKLQGKWFLYDLMRKVMVHPETGFDLVTEVKADTYTVLLNGITKTYRFDDKPPSQQKK